MVLLLIMGIQDFAPQNVPQMSNNLFLGKNSEFLHEEDNQLNLKFFLL